MPLIFLIGMPASGKSTLAQGVAQALPAGAVRVVDTDAEASALAGCATPAQVMAKGGETLFRSLERQALLSLVVGPRPKGVTLVACGGGLPCQIGAMDMMLRSGTVVLLEAPMWKLAERVTLARGSRPLCEGATPQATVQNLQRLWQRRRACYERATERFDASRLETAQEIRASALSFINLFIPQVNAGDI